MDRTPCATSINFCSCSAVSAPESCTAVSIRSSRVSSLTTQSRQSLAYTREWVSRMVTVSSGHFFVRAYSAMVIDMQEPSADMSRSYGPGPRSVPPTATGSSATR